MARYADACSLYPSPDLGHKLDVLRRHCVDEGRDYDAIEKTCAYHFNADGAGGLADDLTGGLLGLAASGIQTVIGIVRGPEPVRTIERLGREVIPAIAGA